MKKDIVFPQVKEVYIAIVHEWNEDFSSHDWNIYLINNTLEPIESVMVMSRGAHRDGRKTSTLRHAFAVVAARSAIKVELIMPEVFDFMNEFIVTYFKGTTLYDATFMAPPNSINVASCKPLPVLQQPGVLLSL